MTIIKKVNGSKELKWKKDLINKSGAFPERKNE